MDTLAIRQVSMLLGLLLVGIQFVGADEDVCIIDDVEFARGDNLGEHVQIVCGSYEEWPCFCNPDLDRMAECPYCSFTTGSGSRYCARDGETILFEDGSISRNCSCTIPINPAEDPVRVCTTIYPDVTVGCNWYNSDGDLVLYENMTSFGETLEGVCGSASEWPTYCLVPEGSSGGDDYSFHYPYCVFDDTASGSEVCAQDGSNVTYLNEEGEEYFCTCTYTIAEGQNTTCTRTSTPVVTPTPAPVGTVPPVVSNAPASPTRAPTSSSSHWVIHVFITATTMAVFVVLTI
eukprot:Nitzschia sp. Nitz4//scaffold75_size92586//48963//49832//NITZ4_004856-RA/size92586-processed-gene-0.9-mRNA-1//1//CDS//3329557708//8623//frame0